MTSTLDELRARYQKFLESDDPDKRALGAVCLAELNQASIVHRSVVDEERGPAPWGHILADLIAASGNQIYDRGRELKTGHEPIHSSSSGKCLSINPEKGLWWCSSCQRGGGAVGWVMDVRNLAYSSATAWLTLKYGWPQP